MTRSVSQALTRTTSSLSNSHLTRLLSSRNRSTRPEPPLIRYSFEAERDPDAERAAIRKLEDAVHRVIVKRSQPDWLPFRPGSSYWVPPKSKSRGFAQVIDRLANSVSVKDPAMAIASHRGWPSSESYFKGGALSTREVETIIKHTTQSEDEEKGNKFQPSVNVFMCKAKHMDIDDVDDDGFFLSCLGDKER
ncbi:hypothetical protein V2J09_004581 [Rumex salicifolius]